MGRNGQGNYCGLIFTYQWPGDPRDREYRLRLDHSDLEADGSGGLKESKKYLSPPGRGNLLYFAPGAFPGWLNDATLPIVITEGEKKTLALCSLSRYGLGESAERPRFLPIGLSGVWNWKGKIGKAPGPHGDLRDVKGVIADFDKIIWASRQVTILFDVNTRTNDSVNAARSLLGMELRRRGAIVRLFKWPGSTPSDVNGVDDLIGIWGHERVLPLLEAAEEPKEKPAFVAPDHWRWLDVSNRMYWNCLPVHWTVDQLIAQGTLVFIAAETQTGKTWLALWISFSILSAERLFGRLDTRPVDRLLYLGLEDPDRRFDSRIAEIEGFFPKLAPGRFIVHTAPDFTLTSESTGEYLDDLIARHRFDVVIIDTYQKATGGMTSFDDEKQAVVLHRLARLTRKHNVTIIVLDHVRKRHNGMNRSDLAMDDIKGTGAKPQNADCVILVERTADRRQIKLQSFSKDSDENIRILLNVSARDSKEPKFTYAGELKESGSHCQRRGQLNESRILAAMKSGNSLASSNIAKTTGLSDATVRRSLTALVEAGSVQKDGTGRWTKYKAINQSEDNCA